MRRLPNTARGARSAQVAGAALLAIALGAPLAAQPAYLDAWTRTESEHFEIWSDAEPARAAEVAAALERFRAVFSRLAPELELSSPAPTRIFAFRDAESYAPYQTTADAGGVKILGQFLSHRDGNYITLNADPGYLGSFAVVYHEFVHYLVQHNLPGAPRWFNEGLAEYYSTFAVEGDRAVVGRPVGRHLDWLRGHSDLRLEDLLRARRQTRVFDEAEKAGRFYAVAWGMVHYLLSGGEEAGARLADLISETAAGGDPVAVFERVFAVRLGELEKRLRRHLLGSELRAAAVPLAGLPAAEVATEPAPPAVLLAALGDLLAHMGRDAEAERHLRLALDYEPDLADAWAGMAYVRDRQDRRAEAAQIWAQAMRGEGAGEGRSASALAHLLYGRHLLARVREEAPAARAGEAAALAAAAEAAFARAVELAPGYAEARAMRGYAHLFGGLDPTAGVPHLEAARRELPERSDLLLTLAQLYLRADREAEARAVVEGDLARRDEPEILAAAREEVERSSLIGSANRAFASGEPELGLRLLDEAVSITSDPDLRMRMEERLDTLSRRVNGER